MDQATYKSVIQDQADAWLLVTKALTEVSPGWHTLAPKGRDAAVLAIKQFGAQTATAVQPEQQPVGWIAYMATDKGTIFHRSRVMANERDAQVCAGQWSGVCGSQTGTIALYAASVPAAAPEPIPLGYITEQGLEELRGKVNDNPISIWSLPPPERNADIPVYLSAPEPLQGQQASRELDFADFRTLEASYEAASDTLLQLREQEIRLRNTIRTQQQSFATQDIRLQLLENQIVALRQELLGCKRLLLPSSGSGGATGGGSYGGGGAVGGSGGGGAFPDDSSGGGGGSRRG